jgi:hypothetical protein
VSAYAPDFFPPEIKYLSDSNQHFREGDPRPELASGAWEHVQLLVHPIWWYSPGLAARSVLQRVVDHRVSEIDSYLCYSNNLWKSGSQA